MICIENRTPSSCVIFLLFETTLLRRLSISSRMLRAYSGCLITKGTVFSMDQPTSKKPDASRVIPFGAKNFIPHGYLVGEYHRPSQITLYAMTGGPERWLRIQLDVSQLPSTFVTQALLVARENPTVRFHGALTGFAINYSETYSVRYDAEGQEVEVLGSIYSPGTVSLKINSRPSSLRFLPEKATPME
jgi:hypothetical protein